MSDSSTLFDTAVLESNQPNRAVERPKSRAPARSLGKPAAPSAGIAVSWARTEQEIQEAQHLRYRVFAEESGAQLSGPEGLDVDRFDPYCDHLLARNLDTLEVIGTYRVLAPHRAARAGGLYAEREFDLSRLGHLRNKMIEIGRACVHVDFRGGGVIMSLWAGLAAYMEQHGYESMLGCTSVSIRDGGHHAADLYDSLCVSHLSAPEYRAFPIIGLPVDHLRTGSPAQPSALLKGYLRVGAKICGAPAWDAEFNTADFLTLLRLSDVGTRYLKHFLRGMP
jgi:putative hemolysin